MHYYAIKNRQRGVIYFAFRIQQQGKLVLGSFYQILEGEAYQTS